MTVFDVKCKVERGGAVQFKYDLLRSYLNDPVFAKFKLIRIIEKRSSIRFKNSLHITNGVNIPNVNNLKIYCNTVSLL